MTLQFTTNVRSFSPSPTTRKYKRNL